MERKRKSLSLTHICRVHQYVSFEPVDDRGQRGQPDGRELVQAGDVGDTANAVADTRCDLPEPERISGARGDPRRHRIWQRRRKVVQDGVSAAPINWTHATKTKMPSQATGIDESRQRQLFEQGGSHIVEQLFPDHVIDEPARQHDPAQSQCGR